MDKNGYVNPKYIRKFAFDKKDDLEIPESVVDFIESRVAKKIVQSTTWHWLGKQANSTQDMQNTSKH